MANMKKNMNIKDSINDRNTFKSIEYKPTILKFIWTFVAKRKFIYIILLLCSIIAALDETITPQLLEVVTKNLELFQSNLVSTTVIKDSIYKMIYFWVFFDLIYRVSGLISTYIFPLLESEIRMFMFNEIQYYKPSFVSDNIKEGFVENAVSDTADGVQEIVEFIIVTLLPTFISVLLSVNNIFKKNLIIGALIGGWALCHILFTMIFLKKSIFYSGLLQEAQNNLAGTIIDSLTNRNLTLQCDKQKVEYNYILKDQKNELNAHRNLLLCNEV